MVPGTGCHTRQTHWLPIRERLARVAYRALAFFCLRRPIHKSIWCDWGRSRSLLTCSKANVLIPEHDRDGGGRLLGRPFRTECL